MSAGRHSISTSRNTWSRTPPAVFTPIGMPSQLDAHLHAQRLIQGNALQVDVDQLILDRLALPVDDHGLGRGLAGDLNVKNRVVPGL